MRHRRHWHLRHMAAWHPRCTPACRRSVLPRPAASPRRHRNSSSRSSSQLAAFLRLCGWPARRRRASARCSTPLRRLLPLGVASRASCEQPRRLASCRSNAGRERLPLIMQACLVPAPATPCCLAARHGCGRCRAPATRLRWSSRSRGRQACCASAPHPRTRCPAAPPAACYAWTRSESAVETRSCLPVTTPASSASRHRCLLPVTGLPATPAAREARCLARRWR